jgi:hypothetical protein
MLYLFIAEKDRLEGLMGSIFEDGEGRWAFVDHRDYR